MSELARAGDERVELLLFSLADGQRFALNVLKIREVVNCPRLTQIPGAHPAVVGVAELRDLTFSVIDTAVAIGRPAHPDPSRGFVIVTDFYRGVQGFLVDRVERIVIQDWSTVQPPPSLGDRYLAGVVEMDGALVELIDLEEVLWEVMPEVCQGHDGEVEPLAVPEDFLALVVDDSSVARHQTGRTLEAVGIPYQTAHDGMEAWELLMDLEQECPQGSLPVQWLVSDIEMPRMDGYTLTRKLRGRPRWQGLYILLHTSINGAVSEEQARAAGADEALTKFSAEGLAEAARRAIAHAQGR